MELTNFKDMKNTIENFGADSDFEKLAETSENGKQKGDTTNLETMFAELTNFLES